MIKLVRTCTGLQITALFVLITMTLDPANITRAVGVKDYFAGKTRWNCTSLRWGGAVATSAATCC
jgi:hypothetical protein